MCLSVIGRSDRNVRVSLDGVRMVMDGDGDGSWGHEPWRTNHGARTMVRTKAFGPFSKTSVRRMVDHGDSYVY
jgi:hypothetical protein